MLGAGDLQVLDRWGIPFNGPAVPLHFGSLAECRLDYQSATQIRLNQCNGNLLEINGELVTIDGSQASDQLGTSANRLIANGTDSGVAMAASTRYYIYRSNSQASFSPNSLMPSLSPPVDVNGVKYLYGSGNGQNWRYVGMVYMDGSTQYTDTDRARNVCSYLNRRQRRLYCPVTTSWTSSNTSWIRWNSDSTLRVSFCCHDDRLTYVEAVLCGQSSSASGLQIGLDLNGTTANDALLSTYLFLSSGTLSSNLRAVYSDFIADGYNYLQGMNRTPTGTATYGAPTTGGYEQTTGILGWVWG